MIEYKLRNTPGVKEKIFMEYNVANIVIFPFFIFKHEKSNFKLLSDMRVPVIAFTNFFQLVNELRIFKVSLIFKYEWYFSITY